MGTVTVRQFVLIQRNQSDSDEDGLNGSRQTILSISNLSDDRHLQIGHPAGMIVVSSEPLEAITSSTSLQRSLENV
jgi:hypothetical protein